MPADTVRVTEAVYSWLYQGPTIMERFTVIRNAGWRHVPKTSILLNKWLLPKFREHMTIQKSLEFTWQNENSPPTLGKISLTTFSLFPELLRKVSLSANVWW